MALFAISIIFGPALSYGKFYLFHFILVFIFIAILQKKLISCVPIYNMYFVFLVFFLSWYVLGLSWSYSRTHTLIYLIYIFFGVSIVFIFSTWVLTVDKFKYIFAILKKVALFEYIITILEILNIFRWPTSPYSKFSILLKRNTVSSDLLSIYSSLNISVPTGFHGNPNNLALFVVMVLPFFLFAKRLSVRLLGFCLTLVIIVFTGSRGNFFALFIGMTAYLFMRHKKTFVLLLMLFIMIFITGLFGIIIDMAKKSENAKISEIASTADALNTYLSKDYEFKGESISVRRRLIDNGITELKKTNGLGIGGGSSQFVQKTIYNSDITVMHNFWVEMLVEGGVLFFVLFCMWYVSLIVKLLLISTKSKDNFVVYISRSLFLSMVMFSIGCISVSIVIYYLNMWLMFGMAISIIHLHKVTKK
jgi:teichuronic acid biosynthesis protein TuaE